MAVEIKDKDRGWGTIKRKIKRAGKGIQITAGIQGAEAQTTRENGITNAKLASVHEFGSGDGTIPQRSFLRSTFDEKRGLYNKGIDGAILQVTALGVSGDLEKALVTLGNRYLSDIKRKIEGGISPPLVVETIEKRRRAGLPDSPPLIATGEMVSMLSVRVKKL